jgi:hypothetical protein
VFLAADFAQIIILDGEVLRGVSMGALAWGNDVDVVDNMDAVD